MTISSALLDKSPRAWAKSVARADNPEEVTVDIADGVRVRVVRSTITSVLAKPDPGATREAARQREDTRVKAETKE